MLLPDEYVRAVAEAVHAVGGVFVLDCIASGAVWVSMRDLGVDILISAPQKGWSGSPCAGYVMLSKGGRAAVDAGTSTSFALDLKKWLFIADEYEAGRAPYHATMPTDALAHNAALMRETEERGFDKLEAAQFELGERVRAVLAARELPSVAAAGYQAPSVVVVHTRNPQLANGAAFKEVGVQIAPGCRRTPGSRRDSRRSASGSSASTSSVTSTAPSPASRRPSTRSTSSDPRRAAALARGGRDTETSRHRN